jgi:hypothetical protein
MLLGRQRLAGRRQLGDSCRHGAADAVTEGPFSASERMRRTLSDAINSIAPPSGSRS